MSLENIEADIPLHEAVKKVTADLKKATTLLSRREARYLTDTYYQVQEFRKAAGGRIKQSKDSGEPNAFLNHVFSQFETVEGQIKNALGRFAKEYTVGR